MKRNLTVFKAAVKNETSTAAKLEKVVKAAFPLAINTRLSSDVGTIHPDTKSKGKAILFTWRKEILKLTEAMNVTQKDFTNTFVTSPLALEAQQVIRAYVSPAQVPIIKAIVEVQAEAEAEQEVRTESAVS